MVILLEGDDFICRNEMVLCQGRRWFYLKGRDGSSTRRFYLKGGDVSDGENGFFQQEEDGFI
jgi:hypothetical protein